MRIVLTEEDFKTLISGGVVEQDGAKIILQDIGYSRMLELLMDQISKSR